MHGIKGFFANDEMHQRCRRLKAVHLFHLRRRSHSPNRNVKSGVRVLTCVFVKRKGYNCRRSLSRYCWDLFTHSSIHFLLRTLEQKGELPGGMYPSGKRRAARVPVKSHTRLPRYRLPTFVVYTFLELKLSSPQSRGISCSVKTPKDIFPK